MMWAGVVVILAVLKFSTSPRRLGCRDRRVLTEIMIRIIGVVSLTMK